LLLAVVARVGGAVAAGRFALALALTGPVMLLAGLGLRHAQMADAAVGDRLPVYIALRGLAVVAALGVIALGAAFGPYDHASAAAILLVGLAKAGESAGEVTYGYLQRRGRFDRVATSQFVRGAFGLAGLLIGLRLGGLTSGLAGLALGWTFAVLLVDLPNLRRESLSDAFAEGASAAAMRELLRSTLPLGLVALLWSTAINLPRYILEGLHGPSALGRFAAAASLIVPAGALANALGQSGARVLALRSGGAVKAAARERWRWAMATGAGIAAAVVVGGVVAGPWVLHAAFGAAFVMSRTELLPYLLAGGAGAAATLFDYLLLAAGRFRSQLMLGAMVWMTTATAAALLVPGKGIAGAASALALSAVVHLVLAALAAWRLGGGRQR
jgi:O-antigen/teichoic acid export membrane protein